MSLTSALLVEFVRDQYGTSGPVPLHAPILGQAERDYLLDCLDSTYVSSIGPYVDHFEETVRAYTGAGAAVAIVNGTAALQASLILSGVRAGDLVVTQPLTFVATANAIRYCGADPLFVDVDRRTLGLSPQALSDYLAEHAEVGDTGCVLRKTGQVVRACVVMHTFGHPADLAGLVDVCARWGLVLIEDAAESLGSLYRGVHTGRFGKVAALSFNGNKIITTGGGGMLLFEDASEGQRARHLTTTAKVPHPYEYVHDEVGYNFRLPNLNAALGCAQMLRLDGFVSEKRALASRYAEFFRDSGLEFVLEPDGCRSNYWLNAVICPDRESRDLLLQETNAAQVQTRPAWTLMNRLPMYADCHAGPLDNAEWLADRLVNLPSSAPRVEAE
jgi:aminotransferase in exopolysaccharide biosynthesis